MNAGTISLLLWVITILGYIFRNLWLRIQKLEKIAQDQANFIAEAKSSVNQITNIFDEIDQENVFRANDYVGQMWLQLKELNETLKNYK